MTGPYEHMKAMYGGMDGLVSKAKELGYKEENILILKGQENELKSQYSECYDNIQSCRHNRDTRTPMEYAQDLVASWIFEDYIVKKIQENPLLEILLAGADKKREILNVDINEPLDKSFAERYSLGIRYEQLIPLSNPRERAVCNPVSTFTVRSKRYVSGNLFSNVPKEPTYILTVVLSALSDSNDGHNGVVTKLTLSLNVCALV